MAEITLNFKKQNPTQDWELDDKGFIYDGETIKKAPKKKEKDLPGEDESKQEL